MIETSLEEKEVLSGLHFLRNYQSNVSNALRDQASVHVEKNDYIQFLLDDPDQYPSQKITHVYHNGKPVDTETITAIAEFSNPSFPSMLDTLAANELIERGSSRALEILNSGGNLIIATNHSDIRDVAEALAAFAVSLRTTAETNAQDSNFHTLLMLGKILTHLEIYGEPATKIIGKLCDRQYFSFPRSNTTESSGLSPKVIDPYNKILRGLVHRQLAKGGNLFGIALSGTTDKPIDDNDALIGLGRVSNGTLKLLQSPNTLVVPVAMWRGKTAEDSVFEIVDVPTTVSDAAQMHRLMGSIATRLSDVVTDKTFAYSYSGIDQLEISNVSNITTPSITR